MRCCALICISSKLPPVKDNWSISLLMRHEPYKSTYYMTGDHGGQGSMLVRWWGVIWCDSEESNWQFLPPHAASSCAWCPAAHAVFCLPSCITHTLLPGLLLQPHLSVFVSSPEGESSPYGKLFASCLVSRRTSRLSMPLQVMICRNNFPMATASVLSCQLTGREQSAAVAIQTRTPQAP